MGSSASTKSNTEQLRYDSAGETERKGEMDKTPGPEDKGSINKGSDASVKPQGTHQEQPIPETPNGGIEVNEDMSEADISDESDTDEEPSTVHTEAEREEMKRKAFEQLEKALSNAKAEKSWKDENGAYKYHVLPMLDTILEINDVMESAGVEIVDSFRRELGIKLVEAGNIEDTCASIVDIHGRNWTSDNDLHKTYYRCWGTLQNLTDGSEAVSEAVVKCKGFMELLHRILQSSCEDYIQNKLDDNHTYEVQHSLDIVHNLSLHESTRPHVRSWKFAEVLEPYLRTDSDEYRLVTLAVLASIIDESQSDIIANNVRSVRVLTAVLIHALRSNNRRYAGFSAKECAFIVQQLARNDSNKKILVKLGVVQPLVTMMTTGSPEEKLEAVRAIRVLAFDEDNQEKLVADETQDVVGRLVALKDAPLSDAGDQKTKTKLSEECTRTLWNLRKKLLQSSCYKHVGESLALETQNQSEVAYNGISAAEEGHVFISYQWSHQEVIKNIYQRILSNKYKVWLDIESMEGSTLEAMAQAVEKASIVVVCLSQKYKDSPNCRAEAEYAFEKRKKIIPCMLEPGYKPDGWLGLIVGTKLRFDFSGKYPFEEKMTGLLKEIETVYGKHQDLPRKMAPQIPAPEPLIAPDVVDTFVTSSAPREQRHDRPPMLEPELHSVRNWTQDDVTSWMARERLPRKKLGSLSGEDIALLACMRREAPDAFYSCLQGVLKIKDMALLSRLVWALHDLMPASAVDTRGNNPGHIG